MRFVESYDSARPYIACFVLLRRGNKVAMVLRKNTGYMDGFYGLPAGKVEYDETFIAGAVREAKEEAGVDINLANLRYVHTVHRHSEEQSGFMDWVDVYFEADSWVGEPYNAEDNKAERLEWIDITNLSENIVPHQRDALTQIARGELYSEFGWRK